MQALVIAEFIAATAFCVHSTVTNIEKNKKYIAFMAVKRISAEVRFAW